MSYRCDTRVIHAGYAEDEATGAVTVPIYQTSTVRQTEPNVNKGFSYARTDHPTRRALEENLAALEGARYGLAFASGMAAIHGVLSTLRSGLERVVSYGRLVGERVSARLENTATGLKLLIDSGRTDPITGPIVIDLTMSLLMDMCRMNFGASLRARAVSLTRARPDSGSGTRPRG